MILKGSQRAGAANLSAHLMNDRDNDHISVLEMRGFVADDLHGALSEAQAISKATRCKQFMFSLSLNPPKDHIASEKDFLDAADRAEKKLGLDGQPRAIIIHEKEGRRHAHVVWSRIDGANLKANNLPHFKNKMRDLSRDLYLDHGWSLPKGLQAGGGKNPLNFTLAEWQQAKRHDLDPREIKQVFQEAWKRSDNLKAFSNSMAGYVATDPDEEGQRHMGRLRDLFLLDGDDLKELLKKMMQSPHQFIASAGARGLQKDEKLLSNVIASVQAETHFLDSPCIRESVSQSDFKFEDLKVEKLSIYLVIPADRIHAFNRWTRLMIQIAITVNARNIADKPEQPVLFILDELPALGKMPVIEQSYGLMQALACSSGALSKTSANWKASMARAGSRSSPTLA